MTIPERLLVAAGILTRGNRVLLTRRPAGTHLEGLWEFPGGKVEPDETPEEALVREIREELGVAVRRIRPYLFVHHQYPEKRILMLTYFGEPVGEPPAGPLVWRWQRISELDPDEMPEADREIVEALRKERPR